MSEAPVAPQNLLAQMEQLLAALNADIVQLDADLQSPPPHGPRSQQQPQQPSQ